MFCGSHARIDQANRGDRDMRAVGQGNCIMVAKRGRPLKSGERYKCGKLKPADASKQPISPALWQRIKTNGQRSDWTRGSAQSWGAWRCMTN